MKKIVEYLGNITEQFSLPSCPNTDIKKTKTAIAAMRGPHSVFDSGHCTVIHCDAGEVYRWLINEKHGKTDIRLTDQ